MILEYQFEFLTVKQLYINRERRHIMYNYKALFNNYKQCAVCKRPLPNNYKEDLCPHCLESQLFNEVKEYIRSNDVNEYEVAEHFSIPLHQVKAWIRDGRIEYKQTDTSKIAGLHCQRCGAPITFGTLCPKCLKLMNGNKGYSGGYTSGADGKRMHYLDKEE